MNNPYFLYSCLLCLFLFLRGIRRYDKSRFPILPSTIFFGIWFLSSLGVFLYSNNFLISKGYNFAIKQTLSPISLYLFSALTCVAFSFFLAQKHHLRRPMESIHWLNSDYLAFLIRKLRPFLILFFLVGLLRLIIVIRTTGFDYEAMRVYYITHNKSILDINCIRIGSYLKILATFYVCFFAAQSAINGISLRKTILTIVLYSPLQLSFGGRLFLLSFFVPFIVSYLLVCKYVMRKENDIIKFSFLCILAALLVVAFQIAKFGGNVSLKAFASNINELFYPSSAFIHMSELYTCLSNGGFDLGYGLNSIGVGSDAYRNVLSHWSDSYNNAKVCVPSILPEIYIDFGFVGSIAILMVIFYIVEKHAILYLKKLSPSNFLRFVVLCVFSYESALGALSTNLKLIAVNFVFIYLTINILLKKFKPL